TGAATYDVAFGASSPPPQVATNQSAASFTPNGLAAGTTYYWQIVARNAAGSTTGPVWSFSTASTTSGLPQPWTSGDVGSTGIGGSASYSNGAFNVAGAGADIWGTADAFQFVSQPVSGDMQIVARVTAEQNTDTYAKAGLMLRQGLTADSAHVIL